MSMDIKNLFERLKAHARPQNEVDAVNAEREARAIEAVRTEREARVKAFTPPIYRTYLEERLPQSVNRDEARRVVGWNFPRGRGLYIVGETRLGKSMMLYELLRRQAMAGKSVEVMHGLEFKIFCGKAIKEPDTAQKSFNRLASVDILAIDDIGKATSPATIEGWFYLLERRTTWQRPIVMTANVVGADIKARINDDTMAEPLIGRIKEFCEVVLFQHQKKEK